jgi:uncharacterized protein YcbK (DUF882 family)
MTSHFSHTELQCKCGCGKASMNQQFMEKLEELRVDYGRPMTISSGYRCPDHNRRVGGVPDSAHTSGCAVDITFRSGHELFMIIKALINGGFVRVGIDFARKFVHVDADPSKPAQVMWGY